MINLIINSILALIGTVVSILLEGSVLVVKTLLKNDLFEINPQTNLVEIMSKNFSYLLSFQSGPRGEVSTIPIGTIMIYLGLFLTFIFTIIAVIESNLSALEGEGAEPPFKILIRGVVTLILILGICGVPFGDGFFGVNGLISVCGDMFSGVISDLVSGYNASTVTSITYSLAAFNIPAQVAMLVMTFALFKGTIEAGIVYVERWLSYCLYICFLPVGIACNASKKMHGNCAQMMIGVVAQIFTIIVTIFGFRIYFNSLSNLSGVTAFGSDVVFNYAIALACLSFVKNSEKIVNALGFKTIANGDTAREFARGSMEMGRNIIAPITRPMQMAAGRRTADAITGSAYAGARRHLGENNLITKGIGAFKTGGPNTEIKGAGIVKDGKFAMPSTSEQWAQGTSRLTTPFNKLIPNGDYAKFSQAMHRVNEGIENNTAISGKDLALVGGTSELENFKTGDTAVLGQVSGSNANALLFTGSTVDLDGRESSPKTYAIVMDNEVLEKGTITRGDATYTINSQAGAIPLSNGSGYMYELNGDLGKRTDYISNNVDSKYSSMVSEYNQIKDEYSGSLNSYINDHPTSMFAHAEKGDDIYAQFERAAETYDRAKLANASVFNEMSSANEHNAEMSWKSRANDKLFEMFEKQPAEQKQEEYNAEDFVTADDINEKL